jgi:quercetin dioxygenase-like cupin family protein
MPAPAAGMPRGAQNRTMNTESFDDFKARALAQGFDEVLERDWAPGTVLETHSHPFAAQAVVTRGEMWLGLSGKTLHLRPGDTFALDRDAPHTERYGPEGATYWVARRA